MGGVLGVDRGHHHAVAQQQLVLHLACVRVSGEVEAQRPEVAGALQRGLHEGTIKVRQQGIAQAEHAADGRQLVRKAVILLRAGAPAAWLAAWLRISGVNRPNSSQRRARSGVVSLAKPHRSAPLYKKPHIWTFGIIWMLASSCSQLEWLSPSQMPP